MRPNYIIILVSIPVLVIAICFQSCNGNAKKEDTSKITEMEAQEDIAKSYESLGPVDSSLYAIGRTIFSMKCSHCHQLDKKVKGPALRGVTKRHSEMWITNLLISLQKLSQTDSVVKHVMQANHDEMKETDNAPKPDMIPLTTKEERRALIEFLRKEG